MEEKEGSNDVHSEKEVFDTARKSSHKNQLALRHTYYQLLLMFTAA